MIHIVFCMLRALLIGAAVAVAPMGVAADPVETLESALNGQPMDAAAFQVAFAGKTVRYARDGVFMGVDEFSSTGRRFTWRGADGICQSGVWDASRLNPHVLCFWFSKQTAHCWRFIREDGGLTRLFGVYPDGESLNLGGPYAISGVSQDGVGCGAF